MNELNLFIPIKKVDVAQRLVYGTLAPEMPDQSGEILDYETAKPAFKAWSDEIAKSTDGKSLGNVRAMHTSVAAGKLTDISFDDATKSIMGCAKIIDDNEWNKVLEGVYTGFSMGGKYVKRWTCPQNAALKRYTPSVAEVSIVDNPCIPSARFEVIKADGSTELRKFQVTKAAEADLKQVWQAKDGSTFDKKADALQKNVDLAVSAVPDAVAKAMDVMQKAQAALAAKETPVEGDEIPAVEVPAVAVVETPAVEKTVEAEPAKDANGNIVTEADAHAVKYKAAVKKAVLSKQLCDIPQLVDVISNLQWLQSGLEWDTLFDDAETSTLPADLKSILSSLCDFLRAMVEDATADITADKASALTAAQVNAIRKITGNSDLLKDYVAPVVEDTLTKMQAEHADALEKIGHDLELEKVAKSTLEKAIGTMTQGFEDMTKRLAHLEAQPMPPKGKASVTVIKGHEGAASGAEDTSDEALIQKFSHLPPEQARVKFAEAKATLGQ